MRRGFTMIEMLLATVLVGVLTTFSVLTFRSVSHGWQVSTDYLDKMQRTDYALNQVVSGLRSMYYPHDGSQNGKYGFINTSGDAVVSLSYDYAAIDTVTVYADANDAEGTQKPIIYVLRDGDWGAMYRNSDGSSSDVDWSVEPTEEVLAAYEAQI